MPRKTGTYSLYTPESSGFNEAAARCRGKPACSAATGGARSASMRPRPDAAENAQTHGCRHHGARGFNEAAARCRGKPLRLCWSSVEEDCFNEAAARCRGKLRVRHHRRARRPPASMRPRPDAAENREWEVWDEAPTGASMRPRPDAAENGAGAAGPGRGGRCFNEAAARCRGKPDAIHGGGQRVAASMRPRPDAAENAREHEPHPRPDGDASMRPRPDAAENGGQADEVERAGRASMRPRPDAAENSRGPAAAEPSQAASMRPRPDAAENVVRRVEKVLTTGGFNEAAARCRGKRGRRARGLRVAAAGFNEAAARCRGKPCAPGRAEPNSAWLQ